jgi:hypothetical protein
MKTLWPLTLVLFLALQLRAQAHRLMRDVRFISHKRAGQVTAYFLLAFLGLSTAVFSQGTTNLGENVNYWNKGQTPVFVADSLYMGAPFLRDTTKPLVVTYLGSQASWLGYLYLMVPSDTGSIVATGGKRYTRIFIMTNHEVVGPAGLPYNQVDLTNVAQGKIHNLDTVIFDYQTYWGAGHWTDAHNPNWADTIPAPYTLGPRYSGPNRSPLDVPAWINTDRFWSTDISTALPNNQWGAVGNNYPQGRRWCVAGWVRFENLNINSDTAEFGFEDENDVNPGAPLGWNGAGDKNFNDIVYHVTGLYIIRGPGFLQLYSKPGAPGAGNPALGGIDSATVGQPFTIYAHVFDSLYNWVPSSDSLVTWTISSVDSAGNLVLTTLKGSSTGFVTPHQAFGSAVVTATFKDPNHPNKPPITVSIKVFIGPGPGTHIVIEADSLARKTQNDRPVGTINVDRTANKTVYAVVRDAYGNFVGFANTATWTTDNQAIATATPLNAKQWAASIAEKSYGNTVLTASEPGLTAGTATIACTGVSGPVPVTATLLDTNGNGHLDAIDIRFPDSVSLATALPTVQQWIQSMSITSDDGGGKVTLTAVSMTSDGVRTIHVVLQENTGSTLETGWSSVTIKLSSNPMTSDGRSAYVGTYVDAAAPVIKSLCFTPSSNQDTLRINYSEPLSPSQWPHLDRETLYRQTGSTQLSSLTQSDTAGNELSFAIPRQDSLSNADSVVETMINGVRPTFHLELCGGVSIITNVIAGGNPFNPRISSNIPPLLRNPGSTSSTGSRIEVALIPAVSGDLLAGRITGKITILDAVGNVVRDTSMFPGAGCKLFWVWDGKTRSGSFAAPGTYLARILIEDKVRGTKEKRRLNIGVKK